MNEYEGERSVIKLKILEIVLSRKCLLDLMKYKSVEIPRNSNVHLFSIFMIVIIIFFIHWTVEECSLE